MKILYIDLCALKRPFDALATDRVQLEALAVAEILSRFEFSAPPRAELAEEAHRLSRLGIGALDAVHLAGAIQARCELFVTCDDRILRLARDLSQPILGIRVAGPLEPVKVLQEEGL